MSMWPAWRAVSSMRWTTTQRSVVGRISPREGRSKEMFSSLAQWRSNNQDIELLLVRGNHDKRAGDPPGDLRIQCEDAPYQRGPFVLDHHPRPSAGGYVLAGHIHPGIRVHGKGRQSERLPCFYIGKDIAILPAFGDFTGLAIVDAEETDAIYAIAEMTVLKVKGRLTTMHR